MQSNFDRDFLDLGNVGGSTRARRLPTRLSDVLVVIRRDSSVIRAQPFEKLVAAAK